MTKYILDPKSPCRMMILSFSNWSYQTTCASFSFTEREYLVKNGKRYITSCNWKKGKNTFNFFFHACTATWHKLYCQGGKKVWTSFSNNIIHDTCISKTVFSTECLIVVQKCYFEEYNTLYHITEYINVIIYDSEAKSYRKDSNIIWSSVTDWLPQSGSSTCRQSPVGCCGRSEITRIKRQMLFFGLSLILPLLILTFGKEINFDLLSCYPQQM